MKIKKVANKHPSQIPPHYIFLSSSHQCVNTLIQKI